MNVSVAPRRYAFCSECSIIDGGNIESVNTIQWLREVIVPNTRGSWGPRHPRSVYVCEQCGSENHG